MIGGGYEEGLLSPRIYELAMSAIGGEKGEEGVQGIRESWKVSALPISLTRDSASLFDIFWPAKGEETTWTLVIRNSRFVKTCEPPRREFSRNTPLIRRKR